MTRHLSDRRRNAMVALSLAATAVGCRTAGPEFTPPAPPAPTSWTSAPQAFAPASEEFRGAWWDALADPEIDARIRAALAGNPDLAGTAARLDEARAALASVEAAARPQASLSADLRAAGESAETRLPGGAVPPFRNRGEQVRLDLPLSWEADLWGARRRAAEAATAGVDAAAHDLDAARLALSATVARTVLALRTLDAERRIVAERRRERDTALALRDSLVEAGLAPASDLARVRLELALLEADAAALDARRPALEHALAILVGVAPGHLPPPALAESEPAGAAREPRDPTLVLPGEVLRRRPDVAAAEARLHAATAAVGVALAARYPTLRLDLAAGVVATTPTGLAERAGQSWSVGGDLLAPLLDGGRRRAAVDEARARLAAAEAAHRSAVLGALRDVEDALAARAGLERRRTAQSAALAEAERVVALAESRREAGLASEFEVLEARATVLDLARTSAVLAGTSATATVDLAVALGGSW